ncbi:MAG: SpoIIE family protein phosphatase [Nitrospiria bacterium]
MKDFRPIEWGIASRTMENQVESGDRYLVTFFHEGALIGVIDGIGHGPEAAEAADTALKTLENYAEEPLIYLINRCHWELRHTRGAAMTIVSFRRIGKGDEQKGKMDWLAVGNVEGILIRANSHVPARTEWVLLNGGVVGYQLPPLRASDVSIAHGDLLILATDGIHAGFIEGLNPNHSPQEIADDILARHRKPTDDALVLAVRYKGEKK